MDFIATWDRHQITFGALEDKISPDNPVRFIDAFVEHIDPGLSGLTIETIMYRSKCTS